MIDKEYGKFRLICDFCDNSAPNYFGAFDDAVSYKKTNGWLSRRDDGKLLDICPECGKINEQSRRKRAGN